MALARGWVGSCLILLALAFAKRVESRVLTLQPQLALTERYTDNVFNSDVESDRRSYFVTSGVVSLSPQLDYRSRGWSLGSKYSIRFSRFPDGNRVTHQANLNIDTAGPRWSGGIRAGFVSTLFDDEIVENNEGILVPRTRFVQGRVAANLRYQNTRRLFTSLGYSYANTHYNSEALTDTSGHSGTFSEGYSLTANDEISLSGTVSYFDFGSDSPGKTASGRVGWNRQLNPSARLTLGTGAGITSGRTWAWLFNLGVNGTYKGGSVQAGYRRDFGFGGGLSRATRLNQQVTVSWRHDLSENLSANLSGRFGETSRIGTTTDPETTTTFWGAATGMSYNVLRWLKGSVSLSHNYQRSQGGSLGVIRTNSAIITLSTDFLPWILL